MSYIYLNGDYLEQDKAFVSVLDRGFLLGDGIYEVIPAFNGKLFRLQQHLKRLQQSLDAIHLTNPLQNHEWENIFCQLVEKNGGGNLSIYLQITRGVAARDHLFPENTTPTIYVMSNPIKPVKESALQNGVSAITLDDPRWQHCHIKAISLLPNVLLKQEAAQQGCDEAILIKDDFLTEGAASNIFIVKDNCIKTPAKSQYILGGITRDLALELAQKNNIDCKETGISKPELFDADEIWLSSSTKEILAITTLDGQLIGSGLPGPMWQKMSLIYQAFKTNL